MPPPATAPLPEMVELLTVAVPPLDMPPPGPLLLEMVGLLTVTVPLELAMPPPPWEGLLLERVELLTVTVPESLNMAPPEPKGELLEEVELLTSSVPPPLYMAPPEPAGAPLCSVRLTRVSFAPLPTSNTRYELRPFISILALPPSMVSPAPSVMIGNCAEVRLMVCPESDGSKLIVSATPVVVSASIIACRREPSPESALVLTV